MPKFLRIGGVAFLLVCMALPVVYWLFDLGYLRFNYPSKDRFPLLGIDVSHHQGEIDWAQIKNEGVRFVFIKATEGADFVDKRFKQNWAAAQANGIATGAYHFFTFCKPGGEQAKNFLRTVPSEAKALPPTLDLEFGGNCNRELSDEDLAKEVTDFVTEVRKVFPAQPIFYATPEFHERYLSKSAHKFPTHTLWLRNVFYEPRQAPCSKWTLWQYANRGRLKGIRGPVDLNVYCGTNEHFTRYFGLN